MAAQQLIAYPLPFLQCVKYAVSAELPPTDRLHMITQLARVTLQEDPSRPSLGRLLTFGVIAAMLPVTCLIRYYLSETEEERAAAMRELGIGFAATCATCIAHRVINDNQPTRHSRHMELAKVILKRLTVFNLFFGNSEEYLPTFCDLIKTKLQTIPENPTLPLFSHIQPKPQDPASFLQLFVSLLNSDTPPLTHRNPDPFPLPEETHYFDNLPPDVQALLEQRMQEEGLL